MAKTLREHLAPIVTAMGYEFIGCEMRNGNALLRVFIDSDRGINLDDCTRVSRQISAFLDVEDPIKGRYTLEVSSPGLNRPLFEKEHYQKYIGNRIKVRMQVPVNQRRNFVGELLRVDDATICISVDAEEVVLPFANIERANLIANIRDLNG